MKRLKVIFIEAPQLIYRYVRTAHEIIARHWLAILGANLTVGGLAVTIHMALVPLVFDLSNRRDVQEITLVLIALPFTAYLMAGTIRYYLELVRDGRSRWLNLFLANRAYPATLVFALGFYGLYRLSVRPLFDFKELDALLQINISVAAVFFCWLVARLIFAPIFFLTEKRTLRNGIKASLLMTSGRTTSTIILLLFFTFLQTLAFFPARQLALDLAPGQHALLITALVLSFAWGMYVVAICACVYVLAFDVYQDNQFGRGDAIEPWKTNKVSKKKSKRKTAKKKARTKANSSKDAVVQTEPG